MVGFRSKTPFGSGGMKFGKGEKGDGDRYPSGNLKEGYLNNCCVGWQTDEGVYVIEKSQVLNTWTYQYKGVRTKKAECLELDCPDPDKVTEDPDASLPIGSGYKWHQGPGNFIDGWSECNAYINKYNNEIPWGAGNEFYRIPGNTLKMFKVTGSTPRSEDDWGDSTWKIKFTIAFKLSCCERGFNPLPPNNKIPPCPPVTEAENIKMDGAWRPTDKELKTKGFDPIIGAMIGVLETLGGKKWGSNVRRTASHDPEPPEGFPECCVNPQSTTGGGVR